MTEDIEQLMKNLKLKRMASVYDEQLRTHTHSFEAAHAAMRPVIAQREKEAGKTDGYSNPQIVVGEAIRPQLSALAARLDAAP